MALLCRKIEVQILPSVPAVFYCGTEISGISPPMVRILSLSHWHAFVVLLAIRKSFSRKCL